MASRTSVIVAVALLTVMMIALSGELFFFSPSSATAQMTNNMGTSMMRMGSWYDGWMMMMTG